MLKRKCIGSLFFLLPTVLLADDLTGSTKFVCTSWQAARCTADGSCENTPPWKLNIPDFVRLDNGLIVLHGVQGQRAWSWVINESSGEGTLMINSEGEGLTLFSTCTPIERLEKR
jgi:hypothetical protein